MARKELNVFSISFLDLLSGALGALIIMFIVVPKMTSEQQETIETMDELNVQAAEVAEMIEELENSVPREVLEELTQQMEQLQETAQQAREVAEQLQEENERLTSEMESERRARYEAEAAAHRARAEAAQSEQEATEARRAAAAAEAAAAGGGGAGAEMFGVSAEFAVVSKWTENLDVDLYLHDLGSGQWCHYQATNPGFAKYLADIQSRENQDDSGYEMIFQQQLKPGTYEVWLHLYSTSGTSSVESYAVFYPYTEREDKHEFSTISINHTSKPTQGGGYKLGTITLTAGGMTVR